MTDEQVLQAVIDKAVKNGWNQDQDALNLFHIIENTVSDGGDIRIDPEYWKLNVWLNYIIFDHSFAKALWGELEHIWIYPALESFDTPRCTNCPIKPSMEQATHCYQYHLQQLVLAENRIEYLKQFVE